jgi:hypothetical protein
MAGAETAQESVSTPSTASRSVLAVDSLAEGRRSVRDRTAPDSMREKIVVCTGRANGLQVPLGTAALDLRVSFAEVYDLPARRQRP